MRQLRCDNCNTRFNVHDDCQIVRCPGCRCEVEARDGTPPTDASTPRAKVGIAILALLLLPAVSYADQYDAERQAIRQQLAVLEARLAFLNSLQTAVPGQQWNADGSVTIGGVRYVRVDQQAACATDAVSVQAVNESGVRVGPVRRFFRRAPRGMASAGS